MKIYLGNLSFEVTEDDLQQALAEFGQVDSVSIIKDRDTGRSKGFGFAEMASSDEAQAAIEGLNGKELKGRTLTVNEARPRPQSRPGGGGGRNKFGGNRGGRSGGGRGGSRNGRDSRGGGGFRY